MATFKETLAAKKASPATQTLKVYNNKGESTIYGSILSPKEDEVNILLTKALIEKIRKAGQDKVTYSITSKLDTTKTYSIPKDSVTVQKKKIKNVSGKYLVISLFNLTTPSGITISPSSLPDDEYKIKILAGGIDLTTDSFSYKTPALVVGNVASKTAALVTVEDAKSNKISDNTVVADQNGSFFTEVRANKIGPQTKARKYLKAQTTETSDNDSQEEINTAFVHAKAETDFYAVTFLDPDKNSDVSEQTLKVDENSTLTANLAKENEELAFEVANDQLQDLEEGTDDNSSSGGENPSNDLGCNIGQFSPKCTSDTEDTFALIGQDFKDFLRDANCNFPQFDLIKKIILIAPAEQNALIGRAYCEHYTREVNENNPCKVYTEILNDYKSGKITNLPCPPPSCKEFQNKSLKCNDRGGFCEDIPPDSRPQPFNLAQICRGSACQNNNTVDTCIHRPMKDLYCARIGIDIQAEECRDDRSYGGFAPGWIQEADDEGNKYCVPSNIPKPQFPAGYTGPQPPSTPKEIANECKLNSCHKSCSEKYGPVSYAPNPSYPPRCEQCDCHRKCDAEAGKLIECNDRDQYFSKKCCEKGPGPIIFFQTLQEQSFPGGGFGPGKGPVGVNVYDCLCRDTVNNFNEKGYVKPEAQKICLESCPPGYEKNANSDQCLPICDKEKGFVRDPGGICRKKCPEGSFDDGGGYCRCPEGQFIGRSGKCEGGPSTCGSNMLPNPNNNGEAQCICPDGQPYWYQPSGGTGSCVAACPNGNPLPASYANYPLKSPIPCNSGGSQNCPAPYVTNPSGAPPCKCPDATPYNLNTNTGSTCVATCPAGLIADYPSGGSAVYPANTMKACLCPDRSYPDQNGRCYSGTGYCSPGIAIGTDSCTCNPGSGAYSLSGFCACPANSGPYTKEYGCTSSSQCPPATPHKCPDGRCVASSSACTSTINCPAPYVTNPNGTPPCKCPDATPISYNATCVASCPSPLVSGTPSGSTGMPSCLCPGTLQYPGANGQCTTSTTSHVCVPGEVATAANPCYCASGATVTGSSGTCQCTNGQTYTVTGCSTSTINCPAPYVTNPSGTPPCKCPDTTPISYNATCVASCPSPLVSGTPSGSTGMPSCLCPGTLQYPGANGQCTTTCTGGQILDPALNSCRCPNNQVLTSGICQCPTGQQADPNNPSNCITPQIINISSASITGNNITISYTKSGFNECVNFVDATTGSIRQNGVNAYGLLCSPSGGTVTASANTFFASPNSQFKLCKGSGTDQNTNTNLSTPLLCSSPFTITTTDTITLSNVVRASNGDLIVTYSKNFADCVGLRQNDINGLRVTSQNQFCGNSGTETVSAASLMSTVQIGTQVALCNDVSNLCSLAIPITGQ